MGYLSTFDAIYLIGVLAAFGAFAVSLLTVSIVTNLAGRKPVMARAAPPEAVTSNVHRLSVARDHAA